MTFPKLSQTTISAVVGGLGMIVYALLPYLEHSPNPTVRMLAGVIAALGFGNGLRAAPDSTQVPNLDDLSKLPPEKPITPAAILSPGPPPEKRDA